MFTETCIADFQRGTMKMDCQLMRLTHRRNKEHFYEGPGYIQQDPDGVLEYRLYSIRRAGGVGLFDQLRTVPGKVADVNESYDLTANAYNGDTWTAEAVELNDLNEVLFFGRLHSIRLSAVLTRNTGYSLRLHFFDTYVLPFSKYTSESRNGATFNALNAASFDAGKLQFEICSRAELTQTIVHCTALDCPVQNLSQRINESLQFFTGKHANWRVCRERTNNTETITLLSPTKELVSDTLQAPLLPTHNNIDRDWTLFIAYFEHVASTPRKCFWHPIAYLLYGARQSASNTADAHAAALALCISALAEFLPDPEENVDKKNALAALKANLLEFAKTATSDADLKDRLTKYIRQFGSPNLKDRLYFLASKQYVDPTYIPIWSRLRNKAAHPSFKDMEQVSADNFQPYYDDVFATTALMYQVIFFLVGYKGKTSDYGKRGFPVRQYPLADLTRAAKTGPGSNAATHSPTAADD